MNNPVPYTELKKFIREQPFKFVRLLDRNRKPITTFNTSNAREEIDIKVNEIVKLLDGKLYPNGIYFIQYKYLLGSKSDEFPIYKGEEIKLTLGDGTPNERLIEVHTMTPDQILEMRVDNERLKIEVDRLNQRVIELESEELSEDEPDQLTTLLEKIGLPLLDKYLDIQERKIKIIEQGGNFSALSGKTVSSEQAENERVINKIKSASVDEIKTMISQATESGQDTLNQLLQLLLQIRPDAVELTKQS